MSTSGSLGQSSAAGDKNDRERLDHISQVLRDAASSKLISPLFSELRVEGIRLEHKLGVVSEIARIYKISQPSTGDGDGARRKRRKVGTSSAVASENASRDSTGTLKATDGGGDGHEANECADDSSSCYEESSEEEHDDDYRISRSETSSFYESEEERDREKKQRPPYMYSSDRDEDEDEAVDGTIVEGPTSSTSASDDERWAYCVAFQLKLENRFTKSCLAELVTFRRVPIHRDGTVGVDDMRSIRLSVDQEMETMIPDAKMTFVAFCPDCKIIVRTSQARIMRASCGECGENLFEKVGGGDAMFVTFSIRDQLDAYLNKANVLGPMMEQYKTTYTNMLVRRQPYRRILYRGHIPLSLFCRDFEAKTSGGDRWVCRAAFLTVNNIPVAAQPCFPLLGAYFCSIVAEADGPCQPPPAKVLLKLVKDELTELREKRIHWKNGGKKMRSAVILTLAVAEPTLTLEMMGHRCGGEFACPYCEMKGKWEEPYGVGDELLGVTFPTFVHEKPAAIRDGLERVRIGSTVKTNQRGAGNGSVDVRGVVDTPALHSTPKFDNTLGHPPDTWHIVGNGLARRLFQLSVKKELLQSVHVKTTRVSEMQTKLRPLKEWKQWTASNFISFLLMRVGVVTAANSEVVDEDKLKLWALLADVVYLAHQEDVDGKERNSKKMEKLRAVVKAFAESWKKKLTKQNCSWEYHVIQHLPLFVEKHGPAFLWDGRILSPLVNALKMSTNNIVDQPRDGGRKFLLNFQTPCLQKSTSYGEEFSSSMKRLKWPVPDSIACTFAIKPLKYGEDDTFAVSNLALFEDCAKKARGIFQGLEKRRVTQLQRNQLIISSTRFLRPRNSDVDDSFVAIGDFTFGQVIDMMWLPSLRSGNGLILVQEFDRVNTDPSVKNQSPINQFEVRASTRVRVVPAGWRFIRKVVHSHFADNGNVRQFFSVLPNEWARW